MATSIKILNGPSKFDLMASLFDGKEVMFDVPGRDTLLCVKIAALEMEDGSHESWNFTALKVEQMNRGKVSGYFSTKTRRGWITA